MEAVIAPPLSGLSSGALRTVPPEETVRRARPWMARMGITRIADVTGLDTIGVPVVMVTRPNARSLSVSQGKGLTLAAAQASGLMESVEHWHAERIEAPLLLASARELRDGGRRLADVTALPRLSTSAFHPHQRTLWIEGACLSSGQPLWVPYEVVHTCYSLPLPPGSGSFLMSSNGLASGNHLLEATLHGICELVERDATTLWHLGGEAAHRATKVDVGTVDDPGCLDLLARFAAAGVEVFVHETTSDIGVPAFHACIVDAEPHAGRPIGPMRGLGCHPSRGVALLRALTEAAQSRLTIIAGARDDVTHGQQGPAGTLENARRVLAANRAEPPARAFPDAGRGPVASGPVASGPVAVPGGGPSETGNHETASQVIDRLAEAVSALVERLLARGLGQVVRVDLTRPEVGIPVVRMVIPGLEPLHEVPGYVPGERAREALARRGA